MNESKKIVYVCKLCVVFLYDQNCFVKINEWFCYMFFVLHVSVMFINMMNECLWHSLMIPKRMLNCLSVE